MVKKKIGEFLVDRGLISWESLAAALDAQKKLPGKLGHLLVKQGYLHEHQLTEALGEFFSLEIFRANDAKLTAEVLGTIPKVIALRHGVIPVDIRNGSDLLVACCGPVSAATRENLRSMTSKRICPVLMGWAEFSQLLERAYPQSAAGTGAMNTGDSSVDVSNPVALLENIILGAIARRASDIHMEVEDSIFRIRRRVDGKLQIAEELPVELAPTIVSRVKVLSRLDIADRRTPQDGAFVFSHEQLSSAPINIRVSTLPCARGEKAVLRLLPPQDSVLGLKELGMADDALKAFQKVLSVPHGIVLVTGPTGSGKSTTLYSVLSILKRNDVNITTVEDPVELRMSGINQVQVDSANKVTFAGALRSILRQDPDIIMVGEIRDAETARLALRAALTGHLVLSTLHTNDSISAFARLIDMGCEPFLLASSVRAVLAQRLVRKICPECGKEIDGDTAGLVGMGFNPENFDTIHEGEGCFYCQNTGFRGRSGLFELLVMNDELRGLVARGADPGMMKKYLTDGNVTTLRHDGIAKIRQGVTTPAEVMKVTMDW